MPEKIVTKGLVLRETQTKEADKILTVLTAEHGRLAVVARGARRRNSRYAAACELLAYSELVLYERNGWQRVVKKVPQPMKNWKQEIQTWNKKRLANLEQSNDTAFEQFWAAYPNKINKGDAHRAFEEVRKLLPDNLVERVRLKASTDNWVKDDGKFVPQPAKWLRNHGWEDGDCQGVSREAAILIDEEKSKWQQPMGQSIKQQMIQQTLPI